MKFAEVYRSCKRTQALKKGIKAVRCNIDRLEFKYIAVSEVKVNSFRDISGYKLQTLEGTAFFPAQPINFPCGGGLTWMRESFASADIVIPPYFQMGFLSQYAGKIKKAVSHNEKMDIGSEMLSLMYPASGMSDLIMGVWTKRKSFDQFHSQLVESTKAHCLGLQGVAITGVLPCIEGIVRRLGVLSGIAVEDSVNIRVLTQFFKRLQAKEIAQTFDDYDWYPSSEMTIGVFDNFHERVQMFGSMSAYFDSRLYIHTEKAPSYLTLNRHAISHGLFQGYATSENYLRLFNLLSALSFAAAMVEGKGSLMHPGNSEESQSLAHTLLRCDAVSKFI